MFYKTLRLYLRVPYSESKNTKQIECLGAHVDEPSALTSLRDTSFFQ